MGEMLGTKPMGGNAGSIQILRQTGANRLTRNTSHQGMSNPRLGQELGQISHFVSGTNTVAPNVSAGPYCPLDARIPRINEKDHGPTARKLTSPEWNRCSPAGVSSSKAPCSSTPRA